jgi:hypothetical protein
VIPVGSFYTLTEEVVDISTVAFMFMPSGVDAPGGELLGI